MPHSSRNTSRRRISVPAPRSAVLVFLAVLVLGGLATGCRQNPGAGIAAAGGPAPGVAAVAASPAAHAADPVERGRYLVTIGGCNDCHTPWIVGPDGQFGPDPSRTLSGHPESMPLSAASLSGNGWGWAGAGTNTAFSGPWGVSFAANLTPDPSGTGAWDEEIFIRTLRSGKHWGQSRDILPPMPWFNYGKMTDEDLKAVFAYLRSLPPVSNHVPQPLPPMGTAVSAG